jgi:hypothetical protein
MINLSGATTFECKSCQSGFTLAKVNVKTASGNQVFYDCLDNSGTAANSETIPFCIEYTLDSTASSDPGNRYYCSNNKCGDGSQQIIMMDKNKPN